MTAVPAVSVVIAVRNGARYLPETVASVRAQTREDWELIVVDDGSDDETPDILRRLAGEDPRIRAIRRDVAGGPYAAANTGMADARGRYVVRLDADDLAPPDRLERQLAFMDARPGLEATLGAWRWIDDQGNLGATTSAHSRSAGVLRWSLCVLPGIVHSTACFRRDAMDDLGGYPELPTSADLWMWCAFARRGSLGVLDDVLVYYRRHEHQITSERAGTQQQMGAQIVREHLEQLSGAQWPEPQVRDLFAAGRWMPADHAAGMGAVERWEDAWRADAELSGGDRRELRRLTAKVRLRHTRVNAATNGQRLRGSLAAAKSALGLRRA